MRRTLGTLGLLGLIYHAAVAQQAPAFEAADVHVSPPGSTESGGFLPNGRLEFRATSLLRLITLAYSVQAERVAGGPSWLDTDRFDVVAKASGNASAAAMRKMLQGLLAERFELAVRQEEQPLPAYVLTVLRRGTQKESSGTGEPECKRANEENLLTLTCRNITMESLVERLPMAAPAYFNLPVLDRTGLKGTYDFKLAWVGRAQVASLSDSLSIFSSIEKQLGVKVERQNTPMLVLTVSHVNRTPAANPPGVSEKLGPVPTEFDVAEVRPSRPGANEDFNMSNGRIQAQSILLKDLIAFAYDVEEDWVKGGEKWLDSDRYDMVAKTAPTASADTLRVMLQSLLAERFRLKVHKEPQPVTVYALTIGKPKLKDADPATRSTCKSGAADGARTYTCVNTSMAQLAQKLPDVAAGYLDHPVVDLTGLKGSYDFTLSWTPRGRLLGGGRGGATPPAGDATPAAADRPVGYTIFEAVDHQLGLKLATQKHPMPVVVIDHIERKPAEN
jgi:uncharacterized protein (TIGR03435 family)